MKTCIRCGVTKEDTEFYRVRKDGSRRQSRCVACDNRARAANMLRGGADRGATGRYCPLCLGMSWRVTGEKCSRCGLEFREETRAMEARKRKGAA